MYRIDRILDIKNVIGKSIMTLGIGGKIGQIVNLLPCGKISNLNKFTNNIFLFHPQLILFIGLLVSRRVTF